MNGLMNYIPKAPFKYESIGQGTTPNFRISDADDNRIATCYDENNARFIVSVLNQTFSGKPR